MATKTQEPILEDTLADLSMGEIMDIRSDEERKTEVLWQLHSIQHLIEGNGHSAPGVVEKMLTRAVEARQSEPAEKPKRKRKRTPKPNPSGKLDKNGHPLGGRIHTGKRSWAARKKSKLPLREAIMQTLGTSKRAGRKCDESLADDLRKLGWWTSTSGSQTRTLIRTRLRECIQKGTLARDGELYWKIK